MSPLQTLPSTGALAAMATSVPLTDSTVKVPEFRRSGAHSLFVRP